MTDLVQLTSDNGIAIITINNPPVNALSPGVPEGISEALDQIAQNARIKATVLIGGGRSIRITTATDRLQPPWRPGVVGATVVDDVGCGRPGGGPCGRR